MSTSEQLPIHNPEMQQVFPLNDFNTISEQERQALKEAIMQHGQKIIVAIHPFYSEDKRQAQSDTPQVKNYNKLRLLYLEQAAQQGWPIIIFEESCVMGNSEQAQHYYSKMSESKAAYFLSTLEAHPAPLNESLVSLESVYQRIFSQRKPYTQWSASEWQEYNHLLQLAGVPPVTVSVEDGKMTPWQVKSLVESFLKAFDVLVAQSWDQLTVQFNELGVQRIKMGGSLFEALDPAIGKQGGCLAHAADELHKRGFRVNLSNYFSYPNHVTADTQRYLNKGKH